MNWLMENKDWIFSGIGVSVLFFIISLFRKSTNPKQVQKSGKNSTNYQASGNINIGTKSDK
ncbi:hypothetical protein ABDZ30_15410 [Aeromonas veronii]|uniref:hypothetical protein n=1 Tax=Aeromonas veronii TaxID=654 RepID=UPI0031FD2D07